MGQPGDPPAELTVHWPIWSVSEPIVATWLRQMPTWTLGWPARARRPGGAGPDRAAGAYQVGVQLVQVPAQPVRRPGAGGHGGLAQRPAGLVDHHHGVSVLGWIDAQQHHDPGLLRLLGTRAGRRAHRSWGGATLLSSHAGGWPTITLRPA